MAVFLALKVDKWTRKSKFSIKNLLILAVLRGNFWQFCGSKKVVFLTFSKFFRNRLGNFEALFTALKDLLFYVFSTLNVDNWSHKWEISIVDRKPKLDKSPTFDCIICTEGRWYLGKWDFQAKFEAVDCKDLNRSRQKPPHLSLTS